MNPALDRLLDLVDRMLPGDRFALEMQECARRIRHDQCSHEVSTIENGVERCLGCGQQRLVSAVEYMQANPMPSLQLTPDPQRLARLEAEMPPAALEWAEAQTVAHIRHRQGDEIACSCGKRWPICDAPPLCC